MTCREAWYLRNHFPIAYISNSKYVLDMLPNKEWGCTSTDTLCSSIGGANYSSTVDEVQ